MTGKFNNLFNHIILSEGFFNVPDSVTSEIKKDFEDIIRFKDDEVPIKNYKLDFSNTKYEFLNELEPNPSVDVKFTKGGGRIKGSFHIASETKLKNNNALIQLICQQIHRKGFYQTLSSTKCLISFKDL